MADRKYLLIYHIPCANGGVEPSPEEMQAMFARWDAWKNQFKEQILELGDGLRPGGRVLKDGVVTDGPFVEGKDVVGGYSIIAAVDYEHAGLVARGCPISFIPGASIEIRELAGY